MTNFELVNRKLNWRPSLRNINALKFRPTTLPENQLPKVIDMESEFSAAYDQLLIGSCVDNAVGGLIERLMMITNYKWQFRPARLFLYYNARLLEGTTDSDAGSSIADCILAANQYGVCPEIEGDGTNPDWLWTYVDDGVKFATKPSDQCYKDAVLHKILKDEVVSLNRNTVLNTLAAKKPFAFGFSVHKSFLTAQMAQTGIMHIPNSWDVFDPVEGGHGIDAIGYKLNTPMGSQGVIDWVKCRNSWGAAWGLNGYFWMPLDQILCNANVADDAHVVDMVGY
jgi:C1A family cysteine protease